MAHKTLFFAGKTACFVAAALLLLLARPAALLAQGGQWQEDHPANSPGARYGHTLITIDNHVFLFGGIAENNPEPLNDCWEYVSDSWSQVFASNPPAGRAYHSAAVVGGKMVIFGGVDKNGQPLNGAWEFDPVGQTWQQIPAANPPPARSDHIMTNVNGNLVVIGGIGSDGQPLDDTWMFDAVASSWTKRSNFPGGHGGSYGATAMAVGNKAILTGIGNQAYSFNMVTDTWENMNVTNPPPSTSLSASAQIGNYGFRFGGEDNATGDVSNQAYYFDLTTNTWTRIADMPEPLADAAAVAFPVGGFRKSAGAATSDMRILVYGGLDSTWQASGRTYIYTPPAGIFPNELARIEVAPDSVDLQAGDTQQFIATGYDGNDNVLGITPIWSADGGSISAAGLYTATTVGNFTVTASVESSAVTGTAAVQVTKPDVNGDQVVNGEDARDELAAALSPGQDPDFDVNGDGQVDGRDVQEILNAIKSGSQGAGRRSSPARGLPRFDDATPFQSSPTVRENNGLSIGNGSGAVGSRGNPVPVLLANDSTVALLQLDVAFDNAILAPTALHLSGRTAGFSAVFADTTLEMPVFSLLQPGLLRILLFDFNEDSLSQQLIAADSSAVLDMLFDVNTQAAPGDTPLGIASYYLVDVAADSLPVSAQNGLFTVTAAALAKIAVSPDSVTLSPGESQQFSAAGSDSFGNPVALQPVWSASGGTIDSRGFFTAGSDSGYFQIIARDTVSNIEGIAMVRIKIPSGIAADATQLPAEFALQQNYPNPFNPETTIEFSVKQKSHVLLRVFDMKGKEVGRLTDNDYPAGRYRLNFRGANLASGLYLYEIKMGHFHEIKKMLLLK